MVLWPLAYRQVCFSQNEQLTKAEIGRRTGLVVTCVGNGPYPINSAVRIGAVVTCLDRVKCARGV